MNSCVITQSLSVLTGSDTIVDDSTTNTNTNNFQFSFSNSTPAMLKYQTKINKTVTPTGLLVDILKLESNSIIVAGGALRDRILGIPHQDIDVFYSATDEEAQSLIKEFILTHKLSLARVVGGVDEYIGQGERIQFIKRAEPFTAQSLIDDFDLTCNQLAVRCGTTKIITGPTTIDDIQNKILRPAGGFGKSSLHSIISRHVNFMERGWKVSPQYMIALVRAIRNVSEIDSTVTLIDRYGFNRTHLNYV